MGAMRESSRVKESSSIDSERVGLDEGRSGREGQTVSSSSTHQSVGHNPTLNIAGYETHEYGLCDVEPMMKRSPSLVKSRMQSGGREGSEER